jgi:hypothetical protein
MLPPNEKSGPGFLRPHPIFATEPYSLPRQPFHQLAVRTTYVKTFSNFSEDVHQVMIERANRL